MKLSFRFPHLQLLFLAVFALALPAAALAQGAKPAAAPAASPAAAPAAPAGNATIKLRSGAVQQGSILGVTSTGVEFQFGSNKATLPLNQLLEVQMPAPAALAAAQQAYGAKDYDKALKTLRTVTDKFRGLPTDWAQLATGMIGDIYVAQGDLAKAEAAYKDFQRFYPGSGSAQADVGMARIAVGNKDFATAKQKLQPITAAAMKEKNVPRASAFAYSQAFYVSGQVKESEGNMEGALEDYLRTITLFYHDPAAASAAQERAQVLRAEAKQKQRPLTVP
jgi:tetratricopeptide (TPR) repeat protein